MWSSLDVFRCVYSLQTEERPWERLGPTSLQANATSVYFCEFHSQLPDSELTSLYPVSIAFVTLSLWSPPSSLFAIC